MLRNTQNKQITNYLHVSNGSFVLSEDEKIRFNSITGAISGIKLKTHKRSNGGEFDLWHLTVIDEPSGEINDISFSRTSNVLSSIVRSLASDSGLQSLENVQICVSTAPNNSKFTNAKVRTNGHGLSWIPGDMPPMLYKRDGKSHVQDDSLRFEWLSNLIDLINRKIASGNAVVYENTEFCNDETEEGDTYDDEL